MELASPVVRRSPATPWRGLQRAGRGRYVVAWLLAFALITQSAALIADLSTQLMDRGDAIRSLLVIANLAEASAALVILMAVYSVFRTLDIARVVPWIWAMGFAGISLKLFGVQDQYTALSEDQFFLHMVLAIAAFTVVVAVFQSHFRRIGRC